MQHCYYDDRSQRHCLVTCSEDGSVNLVYVSGTNHANVILSVCLLCVCVVMRRPRRVRALSIDDRRLSVCLSVTCLTISRERKSIPS